MPLRTNKRQLRKILGALRPQEEGGLRADQLRDDVSDILSKLFENFSKKLKSLESELSSKVENLPQPDLERLRKEFESRVSELTKKDIVNIQEQVQVMAENDIATDEDIKKELEDQIAKVRKEFLNKLSNLGGGQANRQVNINSSVMSARYTDIDFVNSPSFSWTATDVNQKVRIIGSVLAGGSAGGTGDVVGPSSSTDNAIARYDGVTGKLLQNSLVTIDDTGAVFIPNNVRLEFGGAPATPGNPTGLKTGDDGTFLFDTGTDESVKFKGTTGGGTAMGYTDGSFNYVWRSDSAGNTYQSGLLSSYKNISTAGWGQPAIYGSGRLTAQTAAAATVAAYTVGATDGSFLISGNVLVTTSTAHSFSVQCDYTDEGNTARTVTFNVQQLGGTLVTAITNVTGAGPYEGIPLHIRAKASTAITIKTTGTFTTVAYNVEGNIMQIS